MKKSRWLARVLVVLVLSGLLSMTVTVASGVGTDNDPLVTLSYLKETFTKDILKQALIDFDGTLIVVSHDRDFLDGLVTKVYEFGNQRVREHLCGIYEFLETKKMENRQELERK